MVALLDPAAVLFGRTRQAVLSLMFTRPDESFYLREIVRRTGCGTGAVQRELSQLHNCGILRRERDRYFQANPASPLFEPLKQIVVRTMGLSDRLRDALSEFADQIAAAFVFGSFVRGEQHCDSDVDVMIVTRSASPTLEQVSSLLRPEQAFLGREINPFVLPSREFGEKWRAQNHFIQRVVAGEKIFLIGSENDVKRLFQNLMAPRRLDFRPASRSRARSDSSRTSR